MLKLILSMLLIILSFFMFFINHPLAMGLFILIQTMIMSTFMGLFMNTYWFSYIMFIVFMGGLLVLFIYVSSIASNELINFSLKLKLSFLLFITICFLFSMFFYKKLNFMFFLNNEMNNINSLFLFFNENNLNLSKLYDKQTYFLTMLLILYLFITLVVVIKITNIFFGPLRSFN